MSTAPLCHSDPMFPKRKKEVRWFSDEYLASLLQKMVVTDKTRGRKLVLEEAARRLEAMYDSPYLVP